MMHWIICSSSVDLPRSPTRGWLLRHRALCNHDYQLAGGRASGVKTDLLGWIVVGKSWQSPFASELCTPQHNAVISFSRDIQSAAVGITHL